ncbi:MAG: TonB-dependent receptor [Rhizobiaceae bacterium]|nr:MAG: TonB-dependent receptor [Rhizobiaceae bacterium]
MINFARTTRSALLCGALASLPPGMASARAQDASAEASNSDIVVTAQRRNERLVDVPMSVVAISPDTIEKAGVVSVHDLNRLAPGVQINFAGCCTQPAIRGISTLTTGIGFENNVAIYVDGFYSPDNITVNGDLANIQSIEVLKGPQGTLWGRNATGGAILFNTKAPSDVLTGNFQAGYGRYDDMFASGYLSGPISNRVRFSISGYGRKSDGYNKRLDGTGKVIGNATPLRQASVRAKLEIDLTDDLTATIGANYGLSSDPRGQNFNVEQYAPATLPRPPARADQPYTATFTVPPRVRATTKEATLKLVFDMDAGSLTSYTGYARRRTATRFDFDGSPVDLSLAVQDWKQDTFQQGLDLNITSIEGVDLIIGGTYYNDRLENLGQLGFAGGALASVGTATLRAEAWAGYVDATVHLTDKLVLNLGGRYTWERKRAEYRTVNAAGVNITPPGSGSDSFSAFTPRASLRYEISPQANVYATVSKGFRSGGFQPTGATTPALFIPFEPEKITAYEIGFKTAGRLLQFETAAFYYDYRKLQVGVTIPNPITNVGLINLVSNAPKAEVYGIDALVSAQPTERLNVRVGLAYLHARYRNFTNATGNGLNTATNLNVPGQIQDWSNLQMARSPTFSGNVSLDYTIPDVAGGALQLSANANYTDSFVLSNPSVYGSLAGSLARQQRYRQPAYAIVNTQVSWTDAAEAYKLTLFVNNLTDKRYRMTYNGANLGDYSSWAQPLTYGFRVGYSF